MVIDCLEHGGEVDVQLRKILKAHGVEENFHFLSLGVGDDLTGHVDTVGLIEDIVSHVVGEIGVSDLFERAESDLDDVLDFSAGDLHLILYTPGTLLMTSSTSIWQ